MDRFMETGSLRYWAVGAGTALIGLAMYLNKLPDEAVVPLIGAVVAIAAADQIKHRND